MIASFLFVFCVCMCVFLWGAAGYRDTEMKELWNALKIIPLCSVGLLTYSSISSKLADKCLLKLSKVLKTVDGMWSDWQTWSRCSTTCGEGTKTRRRSCNNPALENGGKSCKGPSTNNIICSDRLCPGRSYKRLLFKLPHKNLSSNRNVLLLLLQFNLNQCV